MATLKELHDLSGRVSIITGGAGHLGQAMAATLVEMGSLTILVDRNREILEASASQLGLPPSHCYAVDLEHADARIEFVAAIAAQFGRADIVINNAAFVGDSGLSGWATSFSDQSLITWRRALEVNLTAPFHLIQLLQPLLAQSGQSSIINIASIYGMLGPDWSLYEGTQMANPAAYAASKGGLIQLTRWLSTTLAPKIRVNSIAPGGIDRAQPASFASKYTARTPLGRMGREDDFMGIVAFLASDASAWVTGQNFAIDGGWSAW